MDILERAGTAMNWGFGILGVLFLALGAAMGYRMARGLDNRDGILFAPVVMIVGVIFLTARWVIFG